MRNITGKYFNRLFNSNITSMKLYDFSTLPCYVEFISEKIDETSKSKIEINQILAVDT